MNDKPEAEVNPYTNFSIDESPTLKNFRSGKIYGGIGRALYIVLTLALFLMYMVAIAIVPESPSAASAALATLAVLLLYMVLSLIPVYYRLKNVGMNPFCCLLSLIPIVSIFISLRCLMCPEGYADTKQLDLAGKIIAGIVISLGVACFGLVVIAIVSGRLN